MPVCVQAGGTWGLRLCICVCAHVCLDAWVSVPKHSSPTSTTFRVNCYRAHARPELLTRLSPKAISHLREEKPLQCLYLQTQRKQAALHVLARSSCFLTLCPLWLQTYLAEPPFQGFLPQFHNPLTPPAQQPPLQKPGPVPQLPGQSRASAVTPLLALLRPKAKTSGVICGVGEQPLHRGPPHPTPAALPKGHQERQKDWVWV